MILKALYDYYNRSLDENPNSLPLYGMMNAYISFVIVIKKNGAFVRLEDCRDSKGKGTLFILPYGKHTQGISPFLFWDKCMYIIDYSKANIPLNEIDSKNETKVKTWKKSFKQAHEKHLAFIKKCEMVYKETQDEDLGAVVEFYKSNQLDLLHEDILWKQIEKNPEVNVTFKIEGAITVVASKSILTDFIEKDTEKKGVCLITGKKTYIIRTATPTPIPGCQSSASLVSFQKNSGYDSYGKEQGYNAPISLEAEFAFSTAFKKLIEYNSHNTFTIDARTYVFWSSLPKTPIEEVVHSLGKIKKEKKATKESYRIPSDVYAWFGMTEEDGPNRRLEIVNQASKSIYSGKILTKSDDKFYILGMSSASKGRIAVTYWSETPVNEFAGKLLRHFKDMEIIGNQDKKNYMGLHSILGSVTLERKLSNIPPNLPDAVVKSIFQGLPYPISLFQSCIRRIRAEICLEKNGKKIDPVNTVRAAIIKAYLNRLNDNNNKKINIMLDKENNNQGYLCGRLFAVLDKLQYAANKQNSIRISYMNSASSTPSAVFPTILKLSNSHYTKLVKNEEWLAKDLDKQKGEIMDLIQDFPAMLSLNDQGRFFLGYYHQKNYRKNKETEE